MGRVPGADGSEIGLLRKNVAVVLFSPQKLMTTAQDFNLQGSAGSRAHEDAFSCTLTHLLYSRRDADPL